MTPEVAKIVHRFFDQQALEVYVKDRLESLYKSFEYTKSFEEVEHIKGCIDELRYLVRAKEYAENTLKVLKNG